MPINRLNRVIVNYNKKTCYKMYLHENRRIHMYMILLNIVLNGRIS